MEFTLSPPGSPSIPETREWKEKHNPGDVTNQLQASLASWGMRLPIGHQWPNLGSTLTYCTPGQSDQSDELPKFCLCVCVICIQICRCVFEQMCRCVWVFYVGSWELNSGPQAFVARALLTESLSRQSSVHFESGKSEAGLVMGLTERIKS